MPGLVTIARAFNPFEARIIVATLADAGIAANPLWIETLSNHWSYMLALGGIGIEVAAEDAAAAIAVLAGIEEAPPPGRLVPLLLLPFVFLACFAFSVPLPMRVRAEFLSVAQEV
jgi:hypothetical protein